MGSKDLLPSVSSVFCCGLLEQLADAVADVVAEVTGCHHDEEVEGKDKVGHKHHNHRKCGIVPGEIQIVLKGCTSQTLTLNMHGSFNKSTK